MEIIRRIKLPLFFLIFMSGTIKIAGKEIKAEEVKVSCNVDSEQVEFFLDEIEKKTTINRHKTIVDNLLDERSKTVSRVLSENFFE